MQTSEHSGVQRARSSFVQHTRSSFRRSTICAIAPIRSTELNLAKYRQWMNIKRGCALRERGCVKLVYRISGIFRDGLIFDEFATSLKSPKMDIAKNKPYYTSSLRVLEIAKIGLSENLTHLPNVIFAKISQREKFPTYGNIFL